MSKTTTKFPRKSANAQCEWSSTMRVSMALGWKAITSIAVKIGCSTNTLSDWVKKAEVDSGQRAGISSEMNEKVKALGGRTGSFARPTRSFGRHRRILRWRSSTAGRSDGGFHRDASRRARGRAASQYINTGRLTDDLERPPRNLHRIHGCDQHPWMRQYVISPRLSRYHAVRRVIPR